jgi:hypothetical protein
MSSVSPSSKTAKLILLGITLLVGVGLTYCGVRGLFSPAVGTLISLGYIALIGVLFATGIAPLPQRNRATLLGGRITLFVKSGAWFLAGLLWTAVVVRLVPDTPVGATVLLGPLAVIFGTSVYFFARGVGIFGQRRD